VQDLLAHPAVHAGILPFLVALLIAALFTRSRLAWLAIAAGYATVIALTVGFQFSPLTVSRKILLVVLLAPVVGIAADVLSGLRRSRTRTDRVQWLIVIASAALPLWVFSAMLAQRPMTTAIPMGAAMAAFVGSLVWLTLRLRHDGAAAGAAGLGLGLGGGIAALLSAALGFFGNGVALAAASGAVLLVQFLRGRLVSPGYTGTLTIGLAASLFALATLLLAQLPWYALPLLVLVPAAVAVPRGSATSPRAKIVVLTLVGLLATGLTVLAAYHAATAAPL
jgi:hypothetical protein